MFDYSDNRLTSETVARVAGVSRADDIRARAEKATKGPWRAGEVRVLADHQAPGLSYRAMVERRANQAFIAAAREDIEWLLAERDRLTEALAEARPYVECFIESGGVHESDEATAREALRLVEDALSVSPKEDTK